jgi:very-short-patch-repair endonuclease
MFSVGTYASLSPHDSYYYNNPAEMIRGEITTPLFRLDNPAIIRRHIRSIALEKAESSFPMFLMDMLEQTTLKQDLDIFKEIQHRREEFVEEIYAVFEQSKISWLSKEAIGGILSDFIQDLETALHPFFTTLNNLYARYQKLHTLLGDPLKRMEKSQKKNLEYERNRIRDKLYKMTEDPNEAYTMRVLAQYGFLPSYAFPTNMLQLDAYDFETPIQRDKDIGINEFAPGNLVYVAGGKYEVASVGLDNSLEEKFARYKICKKCGHKMFDDINFIEECLQCGSDSLDEKLYIEPHVLYARRFSPIKASEDIRKRKRFNVQREAIDSTENKLVANINGMLLTYQKESEIVSSNFGLYSDDGEPMGFALCDKCGYSLDMSSPENHDRSLEQHAKSSCDGQFEYNIDLLSRIHADSITIQMPLPEEIGLEYLTTLLHSYLIAASIYFETDTNELRGFIQEVMTPQEDEMFKIVIYDSTLGGSGVLKEFMEKFAEISTKALQVLDECTCEKACYKCLKTYFNQRDHEKLDKRLVKATLQAFAETGQYNIQEVTVKEYKKIVKPLSKSEIEEITKFIEGEETPIERILREAIEKAGLPTPEMQYKMFEGDRLITKPDFAYPEQKIAIFADGFLYHKSKESFERDRNIDRWLQSKGWTTLRFPGGLIYRNVQLCVYDIKRFLEN